MAVGYNPKVVTDGLVIALDAGNTKSYPGSGSTWTDIIGGNTATFSGGPTFSSDNGGYIDFDGINDYIDLGTQLNSDISLRDVTISFWAYIDSTAADEAFVSIGSFTINRPLMIWYDTSVTARDNTGTNDVGGGVENAITVMVTDSTSEKRFSTSNNALSATTWHNISVVLDVTNNTFYTYIDSIEVAKWVDNNTSGGINSSSLDFMISPFSTYLDGRISNLFVHNKALTAAEVKQNYDALKGRYA
tara:strand:- start:688 stop:1425 length:738 start_codon:yes stop_codon:yes gene_type:complete